MLLFATSIFFSVLLCQYCYNKLVRRPVSSSYIHIVSHALLRYCVLRYRAPFSSSNYARSLFRVASLWVAPTNMEPKTNLVYEFGLWSTKVCPSLLYVAELFCTAGRSRVPYTLDTYLSRTWNGHPLWMIPAVDQAHSDAAGATTWK